MKKWIIIILMIIMLQQVYAEKGQIEIYKPRQKFDLSVHLTNKTGEVLNANCSVQIRNETLQKILDDNMREVGNGWYNYTYNISDTGKYYCRQNCTKGDKYVASTCDFEIQGDEIMPIAIIIAVLFIISVYAIFIRLFTIEIFSEHGGVKMMFFLGVLWLMLLPVSIATQFGIDSGVPTNITSQMELLTSIIIWINTFITFYFMLWFIVLMVKKFKTSTGR